MTMDIDTMEAGPELDQLIDDTLFEPWDESRCRVCGWPIVDRNELGCHKDNCSMRPPPKRRADAPADFSTDIAASWQVVDKIKDGKWGEGEYWAHAFELTYISDDEQWEVICNDAEGYAHGALAETAPLAICRAALKAVRLSNTT